MKAACIDDVNGAAHSRIGGEEVRTLAEEANETIQR
jgi:hypothetical protein